MMILALLVAGLSGALTAVLVCQAIHLRLLADLVVGAGAVLAALIAGHLAGAAGWPFVGFGVGFAAVVLYLRARKGRAWS